MKGGLPTMKSAAGQAAGRGFDVGEDRAPGRFAGNRLAGDGVLLEGDAVPLRDGLARRVALEFDAVAGEDGVAVLNGVELGDDQLGDGGLAARPQVLGALKD